MKYSLIPLLALLLASPALGQVEHRHGSYTMPNGDVIPEGQNRPPAGHDSIAFRPNCQQPIPSSAGGGATAWVLNMPDGTTRTLATYPSSLPEMEARRYLSSDGLCAWGGAEVPIIFANQLPRKNIAQQTSDPTMTDVMPDSSVRANWIGVGVGALLLAGVAIAVVKLTQSKPKSKPDCPKSSAHDALSEILGRSRDDG